MCSIIKDLPGDMLVLIRQLIEAERPDLLHGVLKYSDAFKQIELPIKTLQVSLCWDVVKHWEECDFRGPEHINHMCESLLEGFTLPPIIHYDDVMPMDGRHRIRAFRQMGYQTILSIDFDELVERLKPLSVQAA